MREIKKDSTDQSVVIRIIDSTDGTPENAVEHDTSGIDLWYRREGATKIAITEAALAALNSAHSDGGIELIGDGYYRLDLPDAAVATGANGVMVGGTVTGMIVIGCYIPLVDYDPYDSVRAGLTALPNAAANAAGGMPISDAGGLDLDAIEVQIDNNYDYLEGIKTVTDDLNSKSAIKTAIEAEGSSLAQILEDTGELQTDDIPGKIENLNDISPSSVNTACDTAITDAALATVAKQDIIDGIVDDILADTGELQTDDIPGKIATAQSDLDKLTGADGATLATLQGNYAPNKAVPDVAGTAATLHGITDGKIDIVDGVADTILVDTNELQGLISASKIAAQVKGMDADVVDAGALKADAVDEIWTKAMSDLAAGAPDATASVLTAINYLYEAWRNKTITNKTNSEIELYKDDATTKLCEADISDNGTLFTKSEYGAVD